MSLVNDDLRSVLVCESRVRLRCLWRGFSPCLLASCLSDFGLRRESDFEDRVRFFADDDLRLVSVLEGRWSLSRALLSTLRD